jgi:phosphopantothenoylcysteine decarboxylase/phosphopantothenate--cysteine ligase
MSGSTIRLSPDIIMNSAQEQSMVKDKVIVLGISGGIAAYKAAELARLFVKAEAEVHVVMTAHAQEFITPLTFQSLTGNPVHTDLFSLYQEKEIGHISLADRADLLVIAPATANIVGKVANGLADDLLSTTIMATKAPVLFAPAMNVNMWENPFYQKNQRTLREAGYHFLDPVSGLLACGWVGKGKLPEPQDIFFACQKLLASQDLAGETVLVTAGPTREELDPVRYLSNYSSGKMGYAIARAALIRGARVILVSGPSALQPPAGADFIAVTSAAEMFKVVLEKADLATVIIKAAAVADYRPRQRAEGKIKKHAESLTLQLEKNPDILAELGRRKGKRLLIGFAAETENLVQHAQAKLQAKRLDMIVANDVTVPGSGFDADTNEIRMLFPDGRDVLVPQQDKELVAHRLLDEIVALKRGRSEG